MPAQRHLGAGQRPAVGPADDARERDGRAELEVIRDVLGVVAEAEELGGEIAFGLDADRATVTLVREQIATEVETAAAQMKDARRRAEPLDAVAGPVGAPAGDEIEAFDGPAGGGIGHGPVQMQWPVQGEGDVARMLSKFA